jgi:hypothetical protein
MCICVCVLAVARFDFLLGDPDYHQEVLENLKATVKSTKKLCAVCLAYLRIAFVKIYIYIYIYIYIVVYDFHV